MGSGMGNHEPVGWPENLFIKHASIFLPVFRYSRETEQEVKGIIGIFEQFKVPKGGRILDVPCGVGRHAIPFARRGYNVTGVDFSPVFISRARANARKQKVAKRTNFYVGDMRSLDEVLAEEKPFNAIANLWSSIGYYGKEEDLRLFTALKTLALPSCLLVVDNVNRDFLVLHPRDAGISNLGRYQLHDMPKLDLETSTIRNVWRF